ncbi:Macrolide export protein MacA [Aquisphaera giovannonii]|uniref:Macrolide export protein MacA n=1 Tax=Aquisphaera giovannonii TaxID=406548 RepID=A0A5B9VWT5_9BACT|nr:efflux RND transporter periplasmic adaptor subunit [Aquisphaera giovannonii]QEH32534.1 Macrolide export protein MacA [Aquisphaera giovannonii]
MRMVGVGGFAVLAVWARGWVAAHVAERGEKPGTEPPAMVRAVVLRPERLDAGVSYHAAVKEVERAELSFRVDGTIESLLEVKGPDGRPHTVHEGDVIARGTPLAKLDARDYRRERDMAAERLAGAEARRAQAEAEAGLARVERERAERLAQRASATASELDAARARDASSRAALAGARREVESARIALDQAEANLSYCSLASPFERARVASRSVDLGQRVTAGRAAFVVHDLSGVAIAFGVPDTLVGRIKLGDPMEVTSDALPAERFRGVVYKIGAAADARTRTYPVEVRVDDPRGLRPGMIATVHLSRASDALLLPLTALVPRASGPGCDAFVVVDGPHGPVVRRRRATIEDVVDDRATVLADATPGPGQSLAPGDRVVVDGVHRLSDGRAVVVED